MTLIIGIKCSDGVVLGADGAAMISSQIGQFSIQQPIEKKLQVIGDNKAVLAVSGPVALGQKFKSILEDFLADSQLTSPIHMGTKQLQQLFWPPVELQMAIAEKAKGCLGQLAIQNALSESIVVLVTSGDLRLLVCDQQCSFEELEDISFTAIGSGLNYAFPFLAFLKRVFFPNALPDTRVGVFCTVWSLIHSIKTAPGGIAEPLQIMVITNEDGHLSIAEYDRSQIEEDIQACYEAESHLKKFEMLISEGDTAPDSEVP